MHKVIIFGIFSFSWAKTYFFSGESELGYELEGLNGCFELKFIAELEMTVFKSENIRVNLTERVAEIEMQNKIETVATNFDIPIWHKFCVNEKFLKFPSGKIIPVKGLKLYDPKYTYARFAEEIFGFESYEIEQTDLKLDEIRGYQVFCPVSHQDLGPTVIIRVVMNSAVKNFEDCFEILYLQKKFIIFATLIIISESSLTVPEEIIEQKFQVSGCEESNLRSFTWEDKKYQIINSYGCVPSFLKKQVLSDGLMDIFVERYTLTSLQKRFEKLKYDEIFLRLYIYF